MRDRDKYVHKVITLLDILNLTFPNIIFIISHSHISVPKYFGFHVQRIELKNLHFFVINSIQIYNFLKANFPDTIRHLD